MTWPLEPALKLKPGRFYRSKAGGVWCCYQVKLDAALQCQARCIQLNTADRVEYFYLDGRYDRDGQREHCLVEDVTETFDAPQEKNMKEVRPLTEKEEVELRQAVSGGAYEQVLMPRLLLMLDLERRKLQKIEEWAQQCSPENWPTAKLILDLLKCSDGFIRLTLKEFEARWTKECTEWQEISAELQEKDAHRLHPEDAKGVVAYDVTMEQIKRMHARGEERLDMNKVLIKHVDSKGNVIWVPILGGATGVPEDGIPESALDRHPPMSRGGVGGKQRD